MWTYSHLPGQQAGPSSNAEILKMLDSGLTRRLTDYDRTLRIWLRFFPREQMLINTFDELKRDPAEFVAGIYKFLGLSAGLPDGFDENRKVNPTKNERTLDPFHRYYLAGRWLPMLRRLRQRCPDLDDVNVWIRELEELQASPPPGWKWRAALIRLRKDFGHRLVYRPVSGARGYYRSVKMRRNVTRFLRDAE